MDLLIIEAVLVTIFILFAGYLSAAEIAIASIGSNKIDELKSENDKAAGLFESIQKDPNTFYGTIQIFVNLLSISAAIIGFHLLMLLFRRFTSDYENYPNTLLSDILAGIVSVLIVSFFILLFSYLVPKAIGFKYSEKIALISISPLLSLSNIFKFPVKAITSIGNILLLPFKEETNFYQTKMSEDEIRVIISESVKSGTLNKTEQEIIENVFEFNDLHANEVMVPRTDMNAIEMTDSKSEIMNYIIKTGHSLFPVYEESLDNIIGVLHTKDFIKSISEESLTEIRSLIRPAYFVPETKLISEILKEMQKRGERMVVVTDEYGGTEGVITMEDILEEIVGEFGDKPQFENLAFSKLPDGKYHVLGSMDISEFNEKFNISLPESDEYNTIAGFVAYSTGKIMNVGEVFEHNEIKFELIKKIRQKMVQFKVYSTSANFSEKQS